MPIQPLKLLDEEKRLLAQLRKGGAQSRSGLAAQLQVSNAGLTRLSQNLIALGLVEEGPTPPAAGRGRPSVPLHISAHGGFAVGVAVHTGLLEMAIVDYAGGVIALTTERISPPDPRALARLVDRRMQKLVVQHRLIGRRLLGVGLSVPGTSLSRDGSRWRSVHQLPGWRDVPLRQIMDETLGLPVWIENDASAAALAEYYLGGLMQRCSTAVVILLGYGIGAGVIESGRLLRGEVGSAGEVGMLFPGDRPRPSTLDLLAALRSAGCQIDSLADFTQRTVDYQALIASWLDRAAEQLRLAIDTAIAWLDPGAIRLSSPLPQDLVGRLAERLNGGPIAWGDHRGECEVPAFPIEVSALGGASASLGAALLPIHASTSRS